MQCFEKTPMWAGCLASCAPGVHADDPPNHKEPWSCKPISVSAPASIRVALGGPATECYSLIQGINAFVNTGGCHTAASPEACQNDCSADPQCVMYEMNAAVAGPGPCCFEYCRPPDGVSGVIKASLAHAKVCSKWDGHTGWQTPEQYSPEAKGWTTHLRTECQAQVMTRDEDFAQGPVTGGKEEVGRHLLDRALVFLWSGGGIFVMGVFALAILRGRRLRYAQLPALLTESARTADFDTDESAQFSQAE